MASKVKIKVPEALQREWFGDTFISEDLTANGAIAYSTDTTGNCGVGWIRYVTGQVDLPQLTPEQAKKVPSGCLKAVRARGWDGEPTKTVYVPANLARSAEAVAARLKMMDDLYAALVKEVNTHSNLKYRAGILLSDNVHGRDRDRTMAKTSYFVDYLIRSGEFVVATPMAVNPVHSTRTDFTVIQTWYWSPASVLRYSTPRGLRVYGRVKLPSHAAFMKAWPDMPDDVKEDLVNGR